MITDMPQVQAETSALLKVEQVAKPLNCSVSLTWRLIWSGQLPHVRLGRIVRVPRKALEDWIDQNQKVQPTLTSHIQSGTET